jgi:Uncharacterized alpha/beta hydrolase domain (DUF2235)
MTNVSFGESPDLDIKLDKDKIIDFTVGVFFDGTLNNRKNTYIRKEKEKKEKGSAYDKDAVKEDPWGFDKDSYLNDYSNVARMIDFYAESKDKRIYVEGIGTEDGETDTVRGYTTGTGGTGIRAKIRIGCEKIADKIPAGSTVNLIIDTFGFSRGAAASRAFVHEITRPKYSAKYTINGKTGTVTYYDLDGRNVDKEKLPARGHLGLLFEQKKIIVNVFKIRCVGLYDTVSSYGVNFEDDTTDEVDVSEINLRSISHPSVKSVIQLGAGLEWRKNFNLTNINSAGEKGFEFILPGCHCDIGGAYEDATYTQNHHVKLDESGGSVLVRKGSASKEFKVVTEKSKTELVESGWYKPNQLEYMFADSASGIMYKGTRFIYKQYSFIPLQFMCQLASDNESKFKIDELKSPSKFGIPSKSESGGQHILDYVKDKLEQYINAVKGADLNQRRTLKYKDYLDFANEKILINGYIHWSATEKTGHGAREARKRVIKDA